MFPMLPHVAFDDSIRASVGLRSPRASRIWMMTLSAFIRADTMSNLMHVLQSCFDVRALLSRRQFRARQRTPVNLPPLLLLPTCLELLDRVLARLRKAR